MLDTDYFMATAAKLHALKSHVDAAGEALLESALSSLAMAHSLTDSPEPIPAVPASESCQDPGCPFCVTESEPKPEPDAFDLVEPATEVIARLVERLKNQGDASSLALAVEGLTLLRMTMGDYEPDGDGGDGDGDGDDGEPHTGGPSGLVVMVPGVYLRGRGDQPA
jgi:hypothetical protein